MNLRISADADDSNVEQLAITQAKYVVARFLQTFDAIRSSSDTCTIKHQTDISTKYVFGSKVKFHRYSREDYQI